MPHEIRTLLGYLALFAGFWISLFLPKRTRQDLARFSKQAIANALEQSKDSKEPLLQPDLAASNPEVLEELFQALYDTAKRVYAVNLLWPSGKETPWMCSRPVCVSSSDQGDLYGVFLLAGKKVLEGVFVSYTLLLKGYGLGTSPDQAVREAWEAVHE